VVQADGQQLTTTCVQTVTFNLLQD